MRKIWFGAAIAVAMGATSLPLPIHAQRMPPEQRLRRDLQEVSFSMTSTFPKVATYDQPGQMVSDLGWKVIKTGDLKAVGMHQSTGLIAIYEADPNRDNSTEDARFIVLQPWEYMCPESIVNNPRLAGVKPHFDAIASAILQFGKTRISTQSRSFSFEAGSAMDRLLCN